MWPFLFEIGGAPVRTYGVLVALGYLTGILWLMSQRRNMELAWGEFWALTYTLFLAALVGGKLGYLLVEREWLLEEPLELIRNWRSGWVFWGGVFLALFAGWVFQQAYNRLYRPRRYLPVSDYFLTALPLGHWIGRLGCFSKGCCHGRPTDMPWGIAFTLPACDVEEELLGIPLHPTQLYEAAGELAIGLFLVLHVLPNIRRGRYRTGTATFGYLALYALLRLLVEFFRGDDRGTLLGPILSPSQWASLAALGWAGGMLWRRGIRERDPQGRSIFMDG